MLFEWFRNQPTPPTKEEHVPNYLLNGAVQDAVYDTIGELYKMRRGEKHQDLPSLFDNLQSDCFAMAEEFDFKDWPVRSVQFMQTKKYVLFEWENELNQKRSLNLNEENVTEIVTPAQVQSRLKMQWEPTTRLPTFFGNLYRFIGNNTQEEAFIARQVGGNPYDGTNLYSIDLLYKEHFGPITVHPKS